MKPKPTITAGPRCPDCDSDQALFVAVKHGRLVRLECERCRTTYTVHASTIPPDIYEALEV